MSEVHRESAPYLSVVVTARNDDHGGDPLYRMQTFIDSLLQQCERHELDAELIIVEWNPPEDRPSLADALHWPTEGSRCAVRIIDVPFDVHMRLEHARTLPLFQMIAKNVGIRRARGAFVLATNIDVLFDDALIRRIASKRLRPGMLYRVDRYDVPASIDADPREWLDWCKRSVIRVHTGRGSVDTRTGEFYPIGNQSRTGRALRIAIGRRPRTLLALRDVQAVLDERTERLFGGGFARHPPRPASEFDSRAEQLLDSLSERLWDAEYFLRDLVYQMRLGISWIGDAVWLARRFLYWFWCGIREPRLVPGRVRRRLARSGARLATKARAVRNTSQLSRPVRREEKPNTLPTLRGWLAAWHLRRSMPTLRTNACGDFTLMAREDWDSLRAYPELERFSMHIDGLLLFQAYYGGVRERLLPYPIFHLEHGSGFRPDTSSVLELEARLERDEISQITNTEFVDWVAEMRSSGGPLPFNDENWGFEGEQLSENDPMRMTAATS
jgi:hypothetical protein